jgi:hypothetical protein
MVVPAFFVTLAGVLLLWVAFQGAKKAGMERARQRFEREIQGFLAGASAASPERGIGTYEGMATTITVGHHELGFELRLPTAVVPYRELLERFGSADLKGRLYAAGVEVGADGRVRAVVPREEGLAENLGAVANRLPLAGEIRGLRARAPAARVARLERVQAAREIDEILLALTEHFPHAPETQQAIAVAAHREHGSPARVRERAERWRAAHA